MIWLGVMLPASGVCFTPGGETLFEEGVFTSVLAAPAPLPLTQSRGCARGNRRWIIWRELRWGVYLSGCLTAFNFEEFIMHFIWLWKVIYVYIYIYILWERYTIIYYIWYTGASWDTSRVRAQGLPLFLRGGWSGQLGLFQLLIQECHFSYSPKESESQWHSRAKDRSADHHFQKRKRKSSSARMSWCQWPRALEGRPLWGRAVPISTQCPQEIRLLTLPVFQGAAV